jgi:hypothetical protein
MQDRYAGDIGDFGKFALLRALAFDLKVGIIWYLTCDAVRKSNDGKHLAYLEKRERFRNLDCELFDQLKSFRSEFQRDVSLRSVRRLEQCALLWNATYFSDRVPMDRESRIKWFDGLKGSKLTSSDIFFLDPDNGLQGQNLTHKHVSREEISVLRRCGKPLIIYHHQTRVKGGASVEAEGLRSKMQMLGCENAELIRLRPYSSRFYILTGHDRLISRRLAEFAARWEGFVQVY